MSSEPLILGISASHNGSACLLRGERVLVAIQEERLCRVKRQRVKARWPFLALRYCFEAAGVGPDDLDLVSCCVQGRSASPEEDITLNQELQITRRGIPWLHVPHHRAHAVSAFATSGFPSAAALVIDGLGSPYADLGADERAVILVPHGDEAWESISFYRVDEEKVTPVEKQMTPNSGPVRGRARLEQPDWNLLDSGTLGQLYAAVANQIFGDRQAAGKVMGLAAYGQPVIPVEEFFEIRDGAVVFRDLVPARFPFKERWPAHREAYSDLACSVQVALEHALLALVTRLRTMTGEARLVYAGGVALNSVANERIIRESGFDQVHVISAAEDSGVALGVAYEGLHHLIGRYASLPQRSDSFGTSYPITEIEATIDALPVERVSRGPDLIDEVARRLCEGQIGGWFRGGAELGPRALGQRSILCDARRPDAKARLNERVKRREMFRPFAPTILLEDVDEWFELGGARPESPFMLRVLPFRPEQAARVPAVVHADGTGRLQTVTAADGVLYELVGRMKELTGVPIVLNTSFNVAGEPIVETPADALWTFLEVDMDFCVLHDTIVTRGDGFDSILSLVPRVRATGYTVRRPLRGLGAASPDLSDDRIAFDVPTRWGVVRQVADGVLRDTVREVDERRSGWAILERLDAAGRDITEADVLQALAQLRRLGVIDFATAGD
jgi:carbamoyltransferase